jgi:hypothetical protein
MTNQHPITVPAGSITCWRALYRETYQGDLSETEYIATQAARWGADQQLAKDAEWLDQHALDAPHLKITPVGESLKEAMRPNLLSLKEQALKALDRVPGPGSDSTYLRQWSRAEAASLINDVRRALEQLDD